MKGVVFSDAHVDWRTRDYERAPDVLASIDNVVDAAVAMKADVLVFAGDLVEGQDPDERTYTLLADVDARLSRFDGFKVLVPGNHDVVDRAGWRSSLATLERAECVVAERPCLLDVGGTGHVILAMPHVSKAHVGADPQGYLEEQAAGLIATYRQDRYAGRAHSLVAVCHYDPPGTVGGSEEEMQAGERLRIPETILRAPEVDLVLCGHVHRAQSVPRYPGAVDRTDLFGDWQYVGARPPTEVGIDVPMLTTPRPPRWDPMVHVVGSLQRLTHSEEGQWKGFLVFET